jgi:hypothetical protein
VDDPTLKPLTKVLRESSYHPIHQRYQTVLYVPIELRKTGNYTFHMNSTPFSSNNKSDSINDVAISNVNVDVKWFYLYITGKPYSHHLQIVRKAPNFNNAVND